MTWYVDASVLIALGRRNELELLTVLEDVVVLPAVRDEVTEEPEATNVDRFVERSESLGDPPPDDAVDRAMEILEVDQTSGDVALVATVVAGRDERVGVVADDRRIRTVADGLGADVTGTIGVIVHAVERGRSTAEDARQLVRALGRSGFHMTGELLETADELIGEVATNEE